MAAARGAAPSPGVGPRAPFCCPPPLLAAAAAAAAAAPAGTAHAAAEQGLEKVAVVAAVARAAEFEA